MVETKLSGKSMEQRISDRLKPSCDHDMAETVVQKGTGPTRTVTAIHPSGAAHGARTQNAGGVNKKGNV